MKRYVFRNSQRLKSTEQFKSVLSHKCCVSNDLGRLYIADNDIGSPRLGLSIAKKCGNAVIRNRLKRFAREVFRLQQYNIPADYDYLLIFSPKMSKKAKSAEDLSPGGMTFQLFTSLFLNLVERAAKKTTR